MSFTHVGRFRPLSELDLPATTVWPNDANYNRCREEDNARLDFHPDAIAYCYGFADVQKCVRWAREHKRPVAIRSGGHDYEGFSLNNGGLVIDLSRYRGIFPSRDGKTAWIRAGTQLQSLYTDLAEVRRTLPGGTCPTVAIAGLVTGGGFGMLVRRHGLLCDHLRRIRMVDAHGHLRDSAHDRHGKELLWASRGGGGGSFGILLDFQFDLIAMPKSVLIFRLEWPWKRDLFCRLAERWMRHSDDSRDIMSSLTIVTGTSKIYIDGQSTGAKESLTRWLDKLTCDGPTVRDVQTVKYLDAVQHFAGSPGPRQSWKMKSSLGVCELPPEGIVAVADNIEKGPRGNVTGILQFDALGGALRDRKAKSMAFVHRNARYSLQYQAYWDDPKDSGAAYEWVGRAFDAIDRHSAGASYRNYADIDLVDWQDRYFGANYIKLQRVKYQFDPGQMFSFPQSVEPKASHLDRKTSSP